MKRIVFFMMTMLLLLVGCKRENWTDWRLQNQLWLENKSHESDVVSTPTGLRYKVLDEGVQSLPQPDALKSVKVAYTGQLISGYTFDSSTSAILAVSNVVSGFAEGLKKMHPQAHYILYIPYDLAYGTEGNGTEGAQSYIPPYSTLVFDVKLLQVY